MTSFELRPLNDAVEALCTPFALDDLAGESPLFAVQLGAETDLDAETLEKASTALSMLSAVSVIIVDHRPDARLSDLVERFDIVIATEGADVEPAISSRDPEQDLRRISVAVSRTPQAAVMLAELLRHRAYEDVVAGLFTESVAYSTLQAGTEFATWLRQRGPIDADAQQTPPVLAERSDGTLRITLNRPHRANAFNSAMRDALIEPLRLLAHDASLDGAVITGNGTAFCSGGDLADFGTTPDPTTAHRTRLRRNAGWWIHQSAPNIRVEVHGHCIGAGIELPAFAGTVVAQPETIFRLPEVGMGLVPGAGGTVSIPRRIGRHRCAYMAITGLEVNAVDALAWGLIDRIA